MAIVVGIQRHLLSESVHVAEQLEVCLFCLPLCSQWSRALLATLGDLMDLEYARIIVEDTV